MFQATSTSTCTVRFLDVVKDFDVSECGHAFPRVVRVAARTDESSESAVRKGSQKDQGGDDSDHFKERAEFRIR